MTKTTLAITAATVQTLLKDLLKHTSDTKRVARVESHLTEVKAASKRKAPLTSTRIGACLLAFKKANKRRAIGEEVVADFLYARLLNGGRTNAPALRLTEAKFNFEASEVPMQATRSA